MRILTISVKECAGRVLSSQIHRRNGKKLLSKGRLLTKEDAELLEMEGLHEVPVIELEENEVGEDAAVMQIADALGSGSVEVRLAQGGRANLFATESSCILVDDEVLKQVNSTDVMAVATCRNFSYAAAGQRVSTVKSAPLAVPKPFLESLLSRLKDKGPVLQVRPIRAPIVAVLYTDPVSGERASQLFENIMRQRLERLGSNVSLALSALEEEQAVARSLEQLLNAKPTLAIIASTTAPAAPYDVVGRAMLRAGGQIERFLAPVTPGNFLLVSYRGDIPIVAAPGCFRSAKPNVLELVLPPLLAGYRLSAWEIASLGHGGLLA